MHTEEGENMASVKTYYIRGTYKKGKKNIGFGKYIRGTSVEDALEELYSILGSKHRVKRNLVNVKPENIREITNVEEIRDPVVKAFADEENLKLPIKK